MKAIIEKDVFLGGQQIVVADLSMLMETCLEVF